MSILKMAHDRNKTMARVFPRGDSDDARTAPGVTDESLAAAKKQQAIERAEVERITGVRITDDPWPSPLFVVHCPKAGCSYRSVARRSGQELNNLSAHLIAAHAWRES